MDDRADYQISIVNREIDLDDLKEKIFLKDKDDSFNQYREEYNHMLSEKISEGNNDIESHIYIKITVEAKYYNREFMIIERIEVNLMKSFQNIVNTFKTLDSEELLD